MTGIHRFSFGAAWVCMAAAPAAAHACTLAVFAPWHDGVHLIATATVDTVLAGAGGVQYRLPHGDPGGPIFGQVMRAERLGGPDEDRLGGGVDRVVLVPWAYGADCRKERWTESARWVQPGERGLFLAVLRRPEQWVDGLPTFDVAEPYQLPYPQRVRDATPDGRARC